MGPSGWALPRNRSSANRAASCPQDHPRLKSRSCHSHRSEDVQHRARRFGRAIGRPGQAQASAELLYDPRDIPTSLSVIFPSRRDAATEASPSRLHRKRYRAPRQQLLRGQVASRAQAPAAEPRSPYVSKSASCPIDPILRGVENMHGTAGRSCEAIVLKATTSALLRRRRRR